MGRKLHATELTTEEYWTAVEEIVEWAGKQYFVVQLPLPLPEPQDQESSAA